MDKILWCYHSNDRNLSNILGDPGADSGGEGKSKREGKYGTKKNKERREELFSLFFTFLFSPFFTFLFFLFTLLGAWVLA